MRCLNKIFELKNQCLLKVPVKVLIRDLENFFKTQQAIRTLKHIDSSEDYII